MMAPAETFCQSYVDYVEHLIKMGASDEQIQIVLADHLKKIAIALPALRLKSLMEGKI